MLVALQRPFAVAYAVVTLLAVMVLGGSVVLIAAFIVFEERAERYTSGIPPQQFYGDLDAALLDDYEGVFGVAHNSGDRLRTTREALSKGADVIEIDVAYSDGTLRASHDSPLPIIGDWLSRGPTLAESWQLLESAEVVKLDLKERSREYLERLVAFLESNPGPQVIVATRDLRSLAYFAENYPQAIRLLSIPDEQRFAQLRDDQAALSLIDGVTLRHTLVTAENGAWLEDQQLLTLAWTVNDLVRVNELVRLGVDAITTENLAILELLGGREREESRLRYRVPR